MLDIESYIGCNSESKTTNKFVYVVVGEQLNKNNEISNYEVLAVFSKISDAIVYTQGNPYPKGSISISSVKLNP